MELPSTEERHTMNLEVIYSDDEIPADVTDLIESGDAGDFGLIGPDPSKVSDGIDAAFSLMPILVGVFVVFFVAAVGFMIFSTVRNYKASKNAGLDPFTLHTDLAVRAAKSEMLAPKKTLEEKLAELDSLLARGLITRDEYAQARLKALSD